jgi:hypothetical protein
MNAGKIGMNLVMLAIFTVMVGIATQYPPQARFMPFIVGFPGIVMCLIQLFLEIKAIRAGEKGDEDDGRSEIEKAQDEVSRITGRKMDFHEADGPLAVEVETVGGSRLHREAVVWGYFLGLIGSILLFGFWLSVPVFILCFLRFFAERSWRFSLLLTVAATAILYCAFVLGLKVVLHEGFITEAINDSLGLY